MLRTDTDTRDERSAPVVSASKNFPAEKIPEFRDGLSKRERWARDIGASETSEIVIQRLACGETLLEVCWSRGWPYAIVASHVARDAELAAACDAAEKLWADHLVKKGMQIVDGADFETVAVAKLQSEYRKWLAAKVNRQRYGEKVEVSGKVEHTHSLIGILSGIGSGADVQEAEIVPVETVALVAPVSDDGLI